MDPPTGPKPPSVKAMTVETVPAAQRRMDLPRLRPKWYRAMAALDQAAAEGMDPTLAELVKVRVSQLNGCAFCLDKHTRTARERGEQEHRLYVLPAWRETSFFSARERAALALTEAVTQVTDGHVPDDVYDEAALALGDEELAQVLAMAVTYNAWTRIGVATRLSPPAR